MALDEHIRFPRAPGRSAHHSPAPGGQGGIASRLLVVLVVAVLVLLPLAACSESTTANVDPAQIFAESVTAMKALKSFHFTYDVSQPQGSKPLQGTQIVRIVGDVTSEGRMKATIDLETNGVPLQLQFVAAGDTHYVQDPMTQKWQSLPAQFSPVGRINLNAGTIQILEKISDPSYVATEDTGGVQTYHLRGSVAAEDVAAIAGAASSDQPFAGDIWIGVEDHLVRRIEIVGAATNSEDPKTKRTIVLSNFDEDVTIEPPQ